MDGKQIIDELRRNYIDVDGVHSFYWRDGKIFNCTIDVSPISYTMDIFSDEGTLSASYEEIKLIEFRDTEVLFSISDVEFRVFKLD